MSRRWNHSSEEEIRFRAIRKARLLGHTWYGIDHVVLALLDPPRPTDAANVLIELGLTSAAVEERIQKSAERLPTDRPGRTASPALDSLLGTATGLALGLGASTVTDEHILLALAYGRAARMPSYLASFGIVPDAVVKMLMERGNHVPSQLPPNTPSSRNRTSVRVYYPSTQHASVVDTMIERFPPGTAHWGFNVSRWKQGFYWIDADDTCDALELIRASLNDVSAVEAVSIEEAVRNEAASTAVNPSP